MTLYGIIYDFFASNFFNDSEIGALSFTIGGQAIDGNAWLSHTCTIGVLALFLVCMVLFVKWVFRFVSGSIMGMGR